MKKSIPVVLEDLYKRTNGFEYGGLVLSGYSPWDLADLCQKVFWGNDKEYPDLVISSVVFPVLAFANNLFSRQGDGWLFDDYRIIKREYLPHTISDLLDNETIYIFSPSGKSLFGKMKL